MSAVDKLLAVARGEVGYLEKKTNANLYSKTGNAGYNNFTKYAAELDGMGMIYNGPKNGQFWCDVFVDWCFIKAFGRTTGMNMLYQPANSLGASCTYSAGYYQRHGAFFRSPKVGDQIFFTYGGDGYDHTGIVTKVANGRVYTIEGNTSGASGVVANGGGVCEKSYPLGYYQIGGYGRPNYKIAEEAMDMTKSETLALINEVLEKKDPTYHKLEQVPSYWRADIKEMIDAGIIKGSSSNDLGLSRTEAKAAVIGWRMHKMK